MQAKLQALLQEKMAQVWIGVGHFCELVLLFSAHTLAGACTGRTREEGRGADRAEEKGMMVLTEQHNWEPSSGVGEAHHLCGYCWRNLGCAQLDGGKVCR